MAPLENVPPGVGTSGARTPTGPTALVNGRFVLPEGVRTDCTVIIEGDRIRDVLTGDVTAGIPTVDMGQRLVTPGLIDLHVHGALGESFDKPGTGALERILQYFADCGITSVQASLVSAPIEQLVGQVRAVSEHGRRTRDAGAGSRILGLHLEGPFLAPAQCGAHNPGLLGPPSPEDIDRLVGCADDLSMVTLAPELPGALELIRALSGRGVVMAVGHSEADGDQLQAATGAGLRHITHLWSGQGSLTRRGPWRVPGLLEESLASEGLTAEVIADGRHLPAALLTIARRCLPGRLIVVSDASCGTGLPEGSRYTLGTVQCEVRDGVGVVEGEGSFGGSVTPLNQMVRHLVCDLGWPVDEVVHMTTRIPAAILGLAHRTGAITPGLDADLAVFDENFNAVSTMIGGRWLHHKTR